MPGNQDPPLVRPGPPFTLAPGLGPEYIPGTVPEADTFRQPQTPEEWHALGVESMRVLAEVGQVIMQGRPELGHHESVDIPVLNTALVEYHEDHDPDSANNLGQIVKIRHVPRYTAPPVTASVQLLESALQRFEREKVEQAELNWGSAPQPGRIELMRHGHATVALMDLEPEQPDELVRWVEFIRGTAVAGATEARRLDLVSRLRNIWEQDL